MMKENTLKVIAICKGRGFVNFTNPVDNIKEWNYAEDGYFKKYEKHHVENMIIDAFTDYVSHCDNPGDDCYKMIKIFSDNEELTMIDAMCRILGKVDEMDKDANFINGFDERFIKICDTLEDKYHEYYMSPLMDKYSNYIATQILSDIAQEDSMTIKTLEVIAICKGHGFKRFDDMRDNIRDYLNSKYFPFNTDAKGDTLYNDEYIDKLIRHVTYDYIDHCDKPSHILRVIDENITSMGFNWTCAAISALAAEDVVSNSKFVNGFTERINDVCTSLDDRAKSWYAKGCTINTKSIPEFK